MMRPDVRFAILSVVFLVSGVAGLVYEVTWTRRFALLFGTSELATAAVLAAYLGGLGAGAAVAGRLLPRVRRPLRAYALVELGIAAWALSIPLWVDLSRRLVVAILGFRDLPPHTGGATTALIYVVCCFATLLVPTGLMGATLPLLVRHTVQRESQIGSRVGTLYAVNTAGAVIGALATAYLLMPALGLGRTTLFAVGLNLAACVGAALLARGEQRPAWAGACELTSDSRTAWSPILVLVGLSSAVSFTYEVLWTRLLSHLLGSSVYAFATMLASFLAGIAIGSGMASRLATTRRGSLAGFAVAQVGAGVFSVLSFVSLNRFAGLAAATGSAGDALIAVAALLPGAMCIGATFPFAVRFLAPSQAEAGRATARVYAWGTVGAIAGSVGAAFLLLPRLGFAGALTAAASTNLAVAVVACLLDRPRRWRLAGAAAVALATLAVWPPSTPWKVLHTAPLTPASEPGRVVYFAVGRSATVLLTELEGEWMVRTNGLPEGSIQPAGVSPSRYLVTRWLAAAPVLARPDARTVMVVGLGAGVVVEAMPASVETVDVVEIEPEVVTANRKVAAERRVDPLADHRVSLYINDVRSSLMLTRKRYDAIVSQPSHPWTAAAAHLYTREFFALARDHLAPGGVFAQWVGLNFVDQELLASLCATLLDVFDHAQVLRPPTGAALLLVASDSPVDAISGFERLDPEVRTQLVEIGIASAEDVAAAVVLDERGMRHLADGAPLNTDDRNRLQARAPRVIGRALGRTRAEPQLAPHDPLREPLPQHLDRARLVRRLAATGQVARAQRVVEATADPLQRRLGAALLARLSGRANLAERLTIDLVGIDAAAVEARALRLQLQRASLSRGGDPDPRLLPLDAGERAVVDGWQLAARGSWSQVASMERDLAATPASHPLYPDACRLRANWRLASGDPARAREVVALMDAVLALDPRPGDLLLHAAASVNAGQFRGALVTLSDLARSLPQAPNSRVLAVQASRLLAQIPGHADLKATVEDRLAPADHRR